MCGVLLWYLFKNTPDDSLIVFLGPCENQILVLLRSWTSVTIGSGTSSSKYVFRTNVGVCILYNYGHRGPHSGRVVSALALQHEYPWYDP